MDSTSIAYARTTALGSGIPLGGLGAGCVEIREDGRFHNWQLFNNYPWSGNQAEAAPEAWSEDAFFALRWKTAGERDAKVRLLYDDDKKQRGVSGWYDHAMIYNYPFIRNIPGIRFTAQHPFVTLDYDEPLCPLQVRQMAFTPLIPFADQDSALPLGFFTFEISNPSKQACEASILFSLRNFAGYDLEQMTLRHTVEPTTAGDADALLLTMAAPGLPDDHRTTGTMALAAWGGRLSAMPAWTDGRGLEGFPNAAAPGLSQLFYPFRDLGKLPAHAAEWQRDVRRRKESTGNLHLDRQAGWRWRGALCQKVEVAPGETRRVTFCMAWHFPNHRHYATNRMLGHKYATWFADAREVARYGLAHHASLEERSRAFCDATFAGTLDPALTASLNAQLTTFAHAFWWTADGGVSAWEGIACCQTIPNAHTHWSSFQPLMLFPQLYRDMKNGTIERMLADEQNGACEPGCGCGLVLLESERERRKGRVQEVQKDLGGWLSQRYEKLGYTREDFGVRDTRAGRHASWGFTFVRSASQLLRDYLWTGDRAMLDRLWPFIKDGMLASFGSDANGDGLPDGAISFVTYDHWFLPATNVYTGTTYLSELSCAVRLAELVGDEAVATQLRDRLALASASFEELYWNGTYYDLCFDAKLGRNDPGCMAEQVTGLLYTNLCAAPRPHPEDHARASLRAVIQHNLQGEAGLLNGADPQPRTDWRYFARYSGAGEDEALSGQWVTPWTGTEFMVAATMLSEGLVDEAMAIVRNVHQRHVAMGMVFNHMECGEHYFRPMVAWAMLPAIQGLVWNQPDGSLTLQPKATPLHSLFLLPGVWGTLDWQGRTLTLEIRAGTMNLHRLTLPAVGGVPRADLNGTPRPADAAGTGQTVALRFAEPLALQPGSTLRISAG